MFPGKVGSGRPGYLESGKGCMFVATRFRDCPLRDASVISGQQGKDGFPGRLCTSRGPQVSLVRSQGVALDNFQCDKAGIVAAGHSR